MVIGHNLPLRGLVQQMVAGIDKKLLIPPYSLWLTFTKGLLFMAIDTSCRCGLTWKNTRVLSLPLSMCQKNTHTSLRGDRATFVYVCRCVYVMVCPFPESQLASLNICGVLWDSPRISFTYDMDGSHDVLLLLYALITQGIVQFLGKMGMKESWILLVSYSARL